MKPKRTAIAHETRYVWPTVQCAKPAVSALSTFIEGIIGSNNERKVSYLSLDAEIIS